MSVEFTDILPAQFKKHRGKTVRQVYDCDPGYLLWLRDEKLKEGRADYFDDEVLRALNETIRKDKYLQKNRQKWSQMADGRVVPPGQGAIQPNAEKRTSERRPTLAEIEEAQERTFAYADSWGSF